MRCSRKLTTYKKSIPKRERKRTGRGKKHTVSGNRNDSVEWKGR